MMMMILNVLAILAVTFHTSHGTQSSSSRGSGSPSRRAGSPPRQSPQDIPKPIPPPASNAELLSVVVLTGLDNTAPYLNEVAVVKRTNVFFRPPEEQNEFIKWANSKIRGRPRKGRHENFGKLVQIMYPSLNLKANAVFEATKRGGAGQVATNIQAGLQRSNPAEPAPITYDTTSLFIEAENACPRYAMEYSYVKNKFAPDYSKEREFIDNLFQQKLCFKLDQNQITAMKNNENPSPFNPAEPFQLWQIMTLARSWDDIAAEWSTYLRSLQSGPRFNLPQWLIRSENNPNIKTFYKLKGPFFKKYQGVQLATTGMLSLVAGPVLKRITQLLADPNNPNIILPMQESIMRALVIALAGPGYYNQLTDIGYASVLILEKYTTGVRLVFAPSVDELEKNLGSSSGHANLVVKYQTGVQNFVRDIEGELIPKNWKDACSTKPFTSIQTVGGGKLFSQGLDIYGQQITVPQGELPDDQKARLLKSYQDRPKYGSTPDYGYPTDGWKNADNTPIVVAAPLKRTLSRGAGGSSKSMGGQSIRK